MGFHRELVTVMVTKPTKPELRILYRPVLDPVKDVVRVYRAEPVLTRAGEHVVGAKRVIDYDDDSMATARRNAAVLKAAGADLAIAHEAERDVFLMMPINANAMATKESATFMVECLEALPPVCAKAAGLHIFDLPGRASRDILDDVILPLRFTIDRFVIEPPLTLSDYADIAEIDANGVVFDYGEPGHDDSGLARVWSRATMHKLALFVQNAKEKTTLVQATRYECRGIDGQLFGDPKPEIGPRASAAELGRAKP